MWSPLPYALLVDDLSTADPGHRAILEADGWQVDEVGEGSAALSSMRMRRPDVVILRLRSPRLEGLHLLQEMLLDLHLRAVPRVVISDGRDPVERRFALGLGAAAWLSSPVSPERLLAAAWDHLSDVPAGDAHGVPPTA